jgi:hypothetical protein
MRNKLKIFFVSFAVILTLLNNQPCAAFCSLPFRATACFQKLHESATNSISTPENQQSAGAAPFQPGSHQELMYTLGVNLARQLGDISPLVENGEELSNVAKGVLDVIVGRLDEAQQAKLLIANKERLNALLTERSWVLAAINYVIHWEYSCFFFTITIFFTFHKRNNLKKVLVETGQAMLNQMKEVEGTSILDSGVVLHLLEPGPEGPGRGVRPTTASTVKVHYQGTLPDGTVFDSSMGGEPVNIALGQVIPGWKEALLKMHEGETAMIGIPPSAAYGDNVSRIYAQVFCPKTIHLFLEILLRFLICTYDRLR